MTVDEFIQWFHSTSDEERQDLRSKLEALIRTKTEHCVAVIRKLADEWREDKTDVFAETCIAVLLATSPGKVQEPTQAEQEMP